MELRLDRHGGLPLPLELVVGLALRADGGGER
jgi:hypothetical protein